MVLLLSCFFSRSRCLLIVNYEGGGPCLKLWVDEQGFERREEALVYAYLALHGEVSLDELSKELKVNKKTLWRIVDEMVQKGVLERVRRGTYS